MRELRTTTGQTISISYEAATNTVLFAEDDWFADPVRASAVPPRSLIRARAGAPTPAAPCRSRAAAVASNAGRSDPGSPARDGAPPRQLRGTPQGRWAPAALTNTEKTLSVQVMNSRLRRGPPKVTLETAPPVRMRPSSAPAGL